MPNDRETRNEEATDARGSAARSVTTEERGGRAGVVSLLGAANVVLRNRRKLVLLPACAAVLAFAVSLLLPRTYTSTASFMPQTEGSQASRLSNLATQFDLSLPIGDATQSPRFYAELLESRHLMEAAIATEYPAADSAPREGEREAINLLEYYEVDGESRAVRLAAAVERLREDVDVRIRDEIGAVTYSVTSKRARLAEAIASRLIELVNEFNLETRQSRASAERAFLDDRLEQARQELRATEDSLERFLNRNRQYQNSPTLTFEQQRLQRRVSLQQQVATSLAQSFEQAKIDEVRNTPVITVFEPAELPAKPDRRGLLVKALLASLAVFAMVLLWAATKEYLNTARKEEPDTYAELSRLLQSTRDEMVGLRTWFRRRWEQGRANG